VRFGGCVARWPGYNMVNLDPLSLFILDVCILSVEIIIIIIIICTVFILLWFIKGVFLSL